MPDLMKPALPGACASRLAALAPRRGLGKLFLPFVGFSSVLKKGEAHAHGCERSRIHQPTSSGISGILGGLKLIFSLYLQWELSLYIFYITFRYLTLNT